MIRHFFQAILLVCFTSLALAQGDASLNNSLSTPYHNNQYHCVNAIGLASTEGVTQAFARQMAIRDALKNASMKNNLRISSSQEVDNYFLTKSSGRFTTHSKVASYKIISEGMKGIATKDIYDQYGVEIAGIKEKILATYKVEIEACLTSDANACGNVLGNQYQLRLAVSQVVMDPNKSQSVADISNLLVGYQSELYRNLNNLGYKNLVKLELGQALLPNRAVNPNISPDVLQPIRDKTGAQYLLLTVINSASKHNTDFRLKNNLKRFYNHEIRPNARHLEVDWYLIDVINYEITSQHRESLDVTGSVAVGRDKPFGTNAFFATATGTAFYSLLNNQANSVLDELKCKKLETQIIDIRDGDYILYLSSDSGAQVGDTLSVYHKFGRNIRFQGVDLGMDNEPVGFLKIKRIHSKFAIAELVGKQGVIAIGDLVKSW